MSAGLGPGSTNMTGAQLRQTECGFRCGYLSEGDDLADHERHEHATCPECGREPIGSYPVSHKPGCARLRTRHPVTGIGPANAAPRPSAAPRSPQSAGVAAGDGTDGPEPSQGTTGAAPASLYASIWATRYAVSCLPIDDINARYFTLHVEYRGDDQWAVMDGPFGLFADGRRDFEHLQGDRFDVLTALELARQQAPLMTVNGRTLDEALAQAKDRIARGGQA